MTPASPAISAPVRGLGVVVDTVEKTFVGGVQAVAALSLEVPGGQFLSLLGPSGCGKSTLLRLIAGLDWPTRGAICFSRSRTAQDVSFVFQDAHLLPWCNVLHNAALPLELAGVAKSERLDRAEAQLRQVGLADALHRYPAQLSGGMRMRVSLARAMVTSPSLLLLDEPFAALDEITRQHLDERLRQLWIERAMTVIFVTHSINEAAYLADRAIVFSARPARVMLDHDLTVRLPHVREASLRTTALFAEQMRALYVALEGGQRA